MRSFLFPIIFLVMGILLILLWKLGPWNYRKRILSFDMPEGWIQAIKSAIPSFLQQGPDKQKQIQNNFKVLMAEKQWALSEIEQQSEGDLHSIKLKILALGSWIGAYCDDNYFKTLEILELGSHTSHHSFSIQLDQDGPYSEKWMQPELIAQLGLEQFDYPYRGIISEWAAHLTYPQESFKESLEKESFDLSLFPLLSEIYFSNPDQLEQIQPKVRSFFDHYYG